MRRQVISSSVADEDIDNINDFYLYHAGETAAIKVFDAILQAIDFIARNALAGSPVPKMPSDYRSVMVKKYKYKIYYLVFGQGLVKILMVRHGSRKPPSPQALRAAARK